MISTSQKYKQELIAGNRRYVVKAYVTLADGTQLTLTNQDIWEQGVVIDSGISSENSFDIGTAIIGSLTLVIDNIRDNFSLYDFLNADVVLWIGLENDVDLNNDQIYYRIGFYTVDDTSYNGSLITLSCLDNMTWFDIPFSEVTGITYPTTAGQLVASICSHVGVTLGVAHFQNYTMTIPAAPEGEINCREVLQYVAQKCCCYCKINTAGALTLTWYDKNAIIGLTDYDGGTYNTTTTPYSDGCNLDGGSFDPWSVGDVADGGTFLELQQGAWLTQNYEMSVSTDEIVVTGCRLRCTTKDKEYDELWVDSTLELTHPRYVLVIENNPFITRSDAAATANTIGSILAGLPIRAFTAKSANDISYETGDMVRVIDFRGNLYYSWITNLTFTINNSESFSCGAESIKQRKETRFSGTVKTLVEAQQNAENMLSAYDNAVKAMDALAQNAIGYNEYVQTVGGAKIMYRYNGSSHTTSVPPKFQGSTAVFKISGDGVFVALAANGDIAADGTCTFSNGYDANSGTAILNLIYAQGLNAGWITAGTISADRIAAGSISANKISATSLSAISATLGSVSSGNISGSTITSSASDGGSTTISGGKVNIVTSDNAFFAARYSDSGREKGVTFGKKISVIDQSEGVYDTFDYAAFYYALDSHRSSDKRLKKKIKKIPLKESRDLILGIIPRYFEFKKKGKGNKGKRSGFVAQEVREVLDEINNDSVIEREDYIRRDGMRMIEYQDFIAHLVNTTQDLYKQVDELKQELADLKARVK